MADEVELIRRVYELWNSGDEDEMLAHFHPEFVYTTSGAFPGFDPVYRGREGMARFRRTMLEAWETFSIEPEEITEREGHFLVALRFSARGHSSGVQVTLDFHHVGRIRDGKIIRLAAGATREQALEAAGLG